jgi:hypothetical protein
MGPTCETGRASLHPIPCISRIISYYEEGVSLDWWLSARLMVVLVEKYYLGYSICYMNGRSWTFLKFSVFYFFSHSLPTFKSHVVFLVKLMMSEGTEEWMCTKFCEKMRKMMTKLTDVSTVWRSDNEVSGSDISHRGTMNV